MTSISLYGACPEADQEYATPKFGHPKDRRRDLKQIQTGIGTSADGGIPIFHRACDGGAAEVSQVSGGMTGLTEIAGERTFLLAGDSRLISYPNVRDMAGAKVTFIGPAPKQHVPAAVLAACDIEAAAEVAYTALRDTRKPLDDRGTWRAYEDTMVLRPPRGTKGPDITVRRVFVHSTARPALPRSREPGNSAAPARTWTGSPPGWAAGTTPTQLPSATAWPASATPGASPTT